MLDILTLGQAVIRYRGKKLDSFTTSKVPLLLIYLALNPGEHRRERLAGLLWDSSSSSLARNNLSKALTDLRKQVPEIIISTRETVALATDIAVYVDYDVFMREVSRSQEKLKQRGSLSTFQSRQFSRLLNTIDPEFLCGVYVRDASEFENWVCTMQIEMLDNYRYLLQHYIDYLISHHRFQEALQFLPDVRQHDPFNEHLYRQLMVALAGTGRRNDAIALYRQLAHLLASELHLIPELTTIALEEQLRADAFEVPPPLTAPARLPFPSFSVKYPEAYEQLAMVLDDPARQLVMLCGSSVTERLHLAIQYANEFRYDYPDGVYLVQSGAASSVLPSVVETLELEPTGEDLLVFLQRMLASKNLLLILTETTIAPVFYELASTGSQVKLLVTSQHCLNIPGEYVIDLEQ